MAKRKKTNWALLEPTDHLMRYIFGGRAGVGGWTKEQVEKQIKLERIEIKKHQKGSPLWAAYFKELQSLHAQLTWIKARESAGLNYR